jgi:hypothetical protein
MAEWLWLLTSNHWPVTTVGSSRASIATCEKAIQLAYGMSVVLLGRLFVPEIMYKGAPEVFPHQLIWKVIISLSKKLNVDWFVLVISGNEIFAHLALRYEKISIAGIVLVGTEFILV